MSGIDWRLDSHDSSEEDVTCSRTFQEGVGTVDERYKSTFRRDLSIKNLEEQVKKLNKELSLMRTDLAKWFGSLRKPNEQQLNDVAEQPSNVACKISPKPPIKTMESFVNGTVGECNGENSNIVTLKLQGIDSIVARLEKALADYEPKLGHNDEVVDGMKHELQRALEATVAEKTEEVFQFRDQMSVCMRYLEAKDDDVKNLKYLLKLTDKKLEERVEQIKQTDEQLTKLITEIKANEVRQIEDVHAVTENNETLVSSLPDMVRDKIDHDHGSRKIFETDQSVTHVIAASEGRNGRVTGLTVHGDELFVLRFESKGLIDVHNATNFTFERKIKVKEPEEVGYYGLTSCDSNNCLYVSCWYFAGVGYIARVELTGDNKVVEWKVEVKGKHGYLPLGLSVNSEHNLMVACWRQSHALIEYTTRGELVREIQVDVEWPRHAIQLNSSQFLVSHGSGYGNSLHRVCVVDASSGRVLLSYGNKPGSEIGQLNEPRQLAVDSDGFIFVADKGNKRIVVLDSTLKWSHDILLNGGSVVKLKQPFSLYLDDKRELLLVGDDSRVIVATF